MADGSKIEWTSATWSWVTGCTKISDGCLNCYIQTTPPFRIEHRKFSGPDIGATTGLKLYSDRLWWPRRWRKPRRVFVNSLGDTFHEDVPRDLITEAFAVMAICPQHTFQVLTKRHARMRALLSDPKFAEDVRAIAQQMDGHSARRIIWPLRNVHVGVSAENQKWADIRVPALLATPAAVRWISAEPLLGPINLSLWFGDGDGVSAEPGERSLRGGPAGRIGDRSARPSLEDCGPAGSALVGRLAPDSVRAPACGERHGQISPGPRDVRGPSGARPGTSPGMAALQRSDTGGPDHQSQEWSSRRELAGEPGAGHVSGAGDPRSAGIAPRAAGSERAAQRDGEADYGAGAGDLLAPGLGGAAGGDRGGLRRGDADDLEDRTGRPSISWLVAGGESGPGARPCELAWLRQLRDQCAETATPFFCKQLGTVLGREIGAGIKGGDWGAWPEDLRVREFPLAAEQVPA